RFFHGGRSRVALPPAQRGRSGPGAAGARAVRNAFIRALTVAAEKDPRIVFLTADLGFKLFDDFARRCPGRFLNVGVAEANMAGVAAGLAHEGKKPFIYSIVPFATLRCYEQIRNDIAYHEADV